MTHCKEKLDMGEALGMFDFKLLDEPPDFTHCTGRMGRTKRADKGVELHKIAWRYLLELGK
jgi:hypothetical protein